MGPEGRACLHCIWMVWPGATSPSLRFVTEMTVTCQVAQAIEPPREREIAMRPPYPLGSRMGLPRLAGMTLTAPLRRGRR